MPRSEKLLIGSAIFVFVLLLAAMVGTVLLNSSASGTLYSAPPFALSSLISGTERDPGEVALGDHVLPSFIGLTPGEDGLGISIGENVVRELYAMLSPCLAAGLSEVPEALTDDDWHTYAKSSRAVYLRYPSALPVSVLQQVARWSCGLPETDVAVESGVLPVRELVVLLPDGENSDWQLILRDSDGGIWRYRCYPREDYPDEYPTLSQVQSFVTDLGTNFYRYRLLTQPDGTVEPVFLERMRVRNVLLTPGTAVMMQENRAADLQELLVCLDFNPDKLSAHTEADGTQVIVETHGVLQLQSDRVTYTASSDGGISLQQFIGYQESYDMLSDSLRTACTIIKAIRDIHPYYLGGDADLLLTEVSRTEGRLRMVFQYAFDNLLLNGCGPAAVIEVENDRVVLADLYAIALRSLGDFDSSYLELGLFDGATSYKDVTLTYPADFGTGSVFPVWSRFTEVPYAESSGSNEKHIR